MVFFAFPEDARWNDDREAVEFTVLVGEYEGTVHSGVIPKPTSTASRERRSSRYSVPVTMWSATLSMERRATTDVDLPR